MTCCMNNGRLATASASVRLKTKLYAMCRCGALINTQPFLKKVEKGVEPNKAWEQTQVPRVVRLAGLAPQMRVVRLLVHARQDLCSP